MNVKQSHLPLLVGVFICCLFSGWSYAQQDVISSEHVYRIRAECGTETTFGTGFLSAEHQAIVTSLHVVDGACTISAFSETGKRFDNLCIEQSSTPDDIAILGSAELDSYIAGRPDVGYDTHPGNTGPVEGPVEGPAVSIGYAHNTFVAFRRDTLSLKPRSPFADVVFSPDIPKWERCNSPDLSVSVYRIEGIASPGDSGGPVFKRGDDRVVGVISGGRAYDNAIWATSLSEAQKNLRPHACPATAAYRLRNDACRELRYFYTEEEERRSRILFGLPLKDSLSKPKPAAWYESRWLWALGATLGGAIVINELNDDDDPQPPAGNTLTMTIPLP